MLVLLKATEARLQAVLSGSVKYMDEANKQMVSAGDVEEIRSDLYLAILELKDKVK